MYVLFFLSHSLSLPIYLYLSWCLPFFFRLHLFLAISLTQYINSLYARSHTQLKYENAPYDATMNAQLKVRVKNLICSASRIVRLYAARLVRCVWANFFSRSYLLCLFELWAHIQSCICVFEKHIIESVWRVYVCIGHVCMCVCICYCGDDVHLFLTAQMSKWG